MTFELPKLPYSYNALEPIMDALTVEIHYSKHHQAYVNNLNAALANHPELEFKSLQDLLLNINSLPSDIVAAVRNNGGGHYNHSLFWNMLTPNKTQPSKDLLNAINQSFSSLDNFKKEFTEAGKKHFGSGWVWLVKTQNGLKIATLPNQDAPLSLGTPLLGFDLWEHAYYLKYQNRRPDYLQNIWEIVNWDFVSKQFEL